MCLPRDLPHDAAAVADVTGVISTVFGGSIPVAAGIKDHTAVRIGAADTIGKVVLTLHAHRDQSERRIAAVPR